MRKTENFYLFGKKKTSQDDLLCNYRPFFAYNRTEMVFFQKDWKKSDIYKYRWRLFYVAEKKVLGDNETKHFK